MSPNFHGDPLARKQYKKAKKYAALGARGARKGKIIVKSLDEAHRELTKK